MTELAIFFLGAALGLFARPDAAIVPPTPTATQRCKELPAPRGRTLADVQRSAVEAGVAYRGVCLNHDELVDWSERVTKQ